MYESPSMTTSLAATDPFTQGAGPELLPPSGETPPEDPPLEPPLDPPELPPELVEPLEPPELPPEEPPLEPPDDPPLLLPDPLELPLEPPEEPPDPPDEPPLLPLFPLRPPDPVSGPEEPQATAAKETDIRTASDRPIRWGIDVTSREYPTWVSAAHDSERRLERAEVGRD
jgi:hypothetical protein